MKTIEYGINSVIVLFPFCSNFFTYNDEGIRTSKTNNGVKTTYYLSGSQIVAEETSNNITLYIYDSQGSPIGMQYHGASYSANVWDTFWFEKNLQGDIVAVYSGSGTKLVEYVYDAWGNHLTNYFNGGASTQASNNPFRYRGYYYDSDLELYCVGTRYYDSVIGRWINPDKYVSTGQGLTGYNLYAYCGNNPVNRIDPTGEAWWHWALGAAVVAACAIAVIATAGGAAAGIAAVTAVANGVAAATPASTVAAGAFIGASVAYGSAAFVAASTSKSVSEFNSQGDWETVATAAGGALLGGINGYDIAQSQLPKPKSQYTISGTSKAPKHGAIPNSRYIQYDQSTGQIRSDVAYNASGDWYSRVDYMHPHNIGGIDYKPHIHFSAPLNQNGQPIGREVIIPW